MRRSALVTVLCGVVAFVGCLLPWLEERWAGPLESYNALDVGPAGGIVMALSLLGLAASLASLCGAPLARTVPRRFARSRRDAGAWPLIALVAMGLAAVCALLYIAGAVPPRYWRTYWSWLEPWPESERYMRSGWYTRTGWGVYLTLAATLAGTAPAWVRFRRR